MNILLLSLFSIFTLEFFFPVLSFSQDSSLSCSQMSTSCAHVPHYRKLASEMCKTQYQDLGCGELAKGDPEIAKNIYSCDEKSLCEESANRRLEQLKGCFAGAQEVGVDFWETLASMTEFAGEGAKSIRDCWQNEDCRQNALQTSVKNTQYTWMIANPILIGIAYARMRMKGDLSETEIQKTREIALNLWSQGKEYLEKQRVKLACFNAKTQAEMICYGVFSRLSPSAAAKSLAKLPALKKLLGAGSPDNKKASTGALAKMAKLSDAERIAEAEKQIGRTLTEQQREALLKAHQVASKTGRGYGTYSKADLKQKSEILKNAGFSEEERGLLMRPGVAGVPSNPTQARAFATQERLKGDQLRGKDDVAGSVQSFRNAVDSLEVYMKDPKISKSPRDYMDAVTLNARAERYKEAAEYYIKSKANLNSSDRAAALFNELNEEKLRLRSMSFKYPNSAGVQKTYEDHRKLIESVIQSSNITLADTVKSELLKP